MGDDDAGDITLLGKLRHALGQGQKVVIGKAFGRDLEHLLARHLCHVGKFRQACQQFVHGHLGRRVGGAVHGRGARAGNGAAGGQHHHMGFGRGCRRSCGCGRGCWRRHGRRRGFLLGQGQRGGAGTTGQGDGGGHQRHAKRVEGHGRFSQQKAAWTGTAPCTMAVRLASEKTPGGCVCPTGRLPLQAPRTIDSTLRMSSVLALAWMSGR